MTNKCPKCNTDNPDTLKFYGECGTQLPSIEDIEVTATIETPKEELTTGSTFAGRYQIIEELGKGGMGKVYKVHDTKIKEKIALKLIKPEIAKDKKTIERFSNELRLARKIRHKNVCQMFDLGEEKGTQFITMEYVSGEDLRSSIRRFGQLPVGKSISIANQICEGLAEAHKHGVVHRDLKSNNIMIDHEGNVRIMDFGIARSLEAKGITGSGVMIGTPEYMSPEQVEGKEVDQRSDIYSLGIILYEMVTGRVPFEGDTPFTVGVKQKSEVPQNPKEINSQIPDNLKNMILQCLEKEKENRFQSAGELHSELSNIERGIPTTEKVIPKRRPLTSKEITVKFNVKRVLIPTFILLAIIIAAILIWRFVLPTTSAMNSVAVLPFEDLSPGKDQEYLATGIPETLINALSRIEGLHVPGRTSSFSFKGEQDIQKIGQRLGVDTLLEGSIQASGSNLRIMVRLINIDNGYQIWSEEYPKTMDDVFAIQDDIAQSVVKALKVKFKPEKEGQIVRTSTENSEAYSLYLQGLFFKRRFTETDYNRAIELFENALKKDQSFAQAYVGLAQSFMGLSYLAVRQSADLLAQAEIAVKEALKLDDSLPEAHSVLGGILAMYRWDWEKAEQEYKLALKLNPGSASVRAAYAEYLAQLGRYEEAYTQTEKALEIDPLSLGIILRLGGNMADLGRYDEALDYLFDVLETNPKANMVLWEIAVIYIETEEFEKGIQTLHEQIKLMEGENISDEIAMLAYVYARWGKTEEAEEYLRQLISYSEQDYVSPTIFAVVYGALGNLNEAFKWLELAYDQQDSRLTAALVFWYDPIRSDPRFKEMLKKIGLDR